MKISDVPEADANGVRWLLATANNKKEALKLAKCFVKKIPEELKEILK